MPVAASGVVEEAPTGGRGYLAMRYPGHSPSCPARPASPSRDRHFSRSGPGRLTLSSSAKLEIWEATKVSRCPAFGSLPAACGPPEVSEGGLGLGRPCHVALPATV